VIGYGADEPSRRCVMLVIAGAVSIDPADREAAVEAAKEMMRETRKEDGCISYIFSEDLEEPGGFRIFEEWESQEALDRHFEAPHMARFQAEVGKLGVRGMKVQRYEIAKVGPLG
jgi:quinol monooxygenase YgiN